MECLKNKKLIIILVLLSLLTVGTVTGLLLTSSEDINNTIDIQEVVLEETYPNVEIVFETTPKEVTTELAIEVESEEISESISIIETKVIPVEVPPLDTIEDETADAEITIEKVLTKDKVEVVIIERPYLDEKEVIAQSTKLAIGTSLHVGAFNDLEDEGTIFYSLPAFGISVFQEDGLGFGGSLYVAHGVLGTSSVVIDSLIGLSYGHYFDKVVLSSTGGIYGTFMSYSRDGYTNELSSLGLGVDIKLLFPIKESLNHWGVKLGVNTGFIGDPHGSLTIGFVIN